MPLTRMKSVYARTSDIFERALMHICVHGDLRLKIEDSSYTSYIETGFDWSILLITYFVIDFKNGIGFG